MWKVTPSPHTIPMPLTEYIVYCWNGWQECVARKLPASGNIKALIRRLEENDTLKDDLKKNPGTPDKLC